MKRIFACMLVLALMLIGTAWAANVVSPGEDFFYLDTANVLSQETEGIIYFCNRQLEVLCGGQIVVAALDSIGDADIYDYAYDLFNTWGIGSVEENNGFLLLMAIEEDNYYALTGSGIDGVLSSSVLKEMNDEYLEPDFAKKDYDAGALKSFEAVLDKYNDYYNLGITIEDGKSAYESYMEEYPSAANLGGAAGGGSEFSGGGSGVVWHDGEFYYNDFHRAGFSGFFDLIWDFAGSIVGIIVLIVVLNIIFGGRGGSFRRFMFFPFFTSSHRHHHRHYDHHNPHGHNHHHRTPPTGGFGRGFGGGAGRSGRTGGFGGSRGGGGRSFGGGAGRGRR